MSIKIHAGNGVYNGEEFLGKIEGDKCILLKDAPPNLKGAINKAAARKLTFEVQPVGPTGPEGPTGPDDSNLNAPAGPEGPEGVSEVIPTSPPSPPAHAVDSAADPEPRQDPMRGSKDPVWLAWKQRQGRR